MRHRLCTTAAAYNCLCATAGAPLPACQCPCATGSVPRLGATAGCHRIPPSGADQSLKRRQSKNEMCATACVPLPVCHRLSPLGAAVCVPLPCIRHVTACVPLLVSHRLGTTACVTAWVPLPMPTMDPSPKTSENASGHQQLSQVHASFRWAPFNQIGTTRNSVHTTATTRSSVQNKKQPSLTRGASVGRQKR